MLLKNAHRAVVDARRIVDYALNPNNPVGRHKARVFASALGFDRSNVHLLIEEIQRGVVAHADMPVTGPKGRATLRTAWIYRTGSDVPELLTLHVR